MKTCVYLLSLALLFCVPVTKAAAPGNLLAPILPWTGSYYDRDQGGSGLIVDIGPSGRMFVTFATYDGQGRQVNWLAEVPYEPTSNVERAETGVIGRAFANFYIATNGQCPGCPYQAPDRTFVGETATFEWETPRHVVMTLDNSGYVYNFRAVNMESRDDDEFIDGTWSVAVEVDPTPVIEDRRITLFALVEIAPAPFTTAALSLDPNAAASVTLPPEGAKLHVVRCAKNTENQLDGDACRQALYFLFTGVRYADASLFDLSHEGLVWFDPVTKTAGMDVVHAEGGGYVVGPVNYHHDLYIEPNRLQSRIRVQGGIPDLGIEDGDGLVGATFTRVRAGAVREVSDYNHDANW